MIPLSFFFLTYYKKYNSLKKKNIMIIITKIASITYKTLLSLNFVEAFINCVTILWWHVKFSWISLSLIKSYIKLTEKENNSLVYLKILLSSTLNDFVNTIKNITYTKNL